MSKLLTNEDLLNPGGDAMPAREAIELTRRGQFKEAIKMFEHGMCFVNKPVATSYYALCLAVIERDYEHAFELSLIAVKREPGNPDLYLNIAKILLLADRRSNAVKAIMKGLVVDNEHKGLIKILKKLGIRQKRLVGSLPRSHALNRFAGRVSHRVKASGNIKYSRRKGY